MFTHAPFDGFAEDKITQHFGENKDRYLTACGHEGVDLSVVVGTPIFAMHPGRIRVSELQNAYGEVIVVALDEYETTYAHLSVRHVVVGQDVQAGDIIGLSGNTGNSTGPHLHLGLRVAPWSYGGDCNGYSNIEPALADVY